MNQILTTSFDWIRFDEKNIPLDSIRPASKNPLFYSIRKQKHSIRNRTNYNYEFKKFIATPRNFRLRRLCQ
jgi:hypothetical protein